MFRIVKRIFEFIKSLCVKSSFEKDDELSQIKNGVKRLLCELKPVGSPEKILETTVAIRHANVMLQCLDTMILTTEPKIFAAKYWDLMAFAERIGEFKYIDKKAQTVVCDITDRLSNMRISAPDADEDGPVYYSVTFGDKPKEYYYLSGGKQYCEGQYVLVPVNDDMEIKVVKIVSVQHFTLTNAPMPPDRLKDIISRAIEN